MLESNPRVVVPPRVNRLGQVVEPIDLGAVTFRVSASVRRSEIAEALLHICHKLWEWGEVSSEEAAMNLRALSGQDPHQVVSRWNSPNGWPVNVTITTDFSCPSGTTTLVSVEDSMESSSLQSNSPKKSSE